MILRLVLAFTIFGLTASEDDLILKTSFGAVQGYQSTSSDGTRVRIFKSVPFAAPPVGDLRWRMPEYPRGWDGVRDGTKYSAACMSNSTTTKSPQPWVDEDCLYLNVFAHGECSKEKKCPMVVYFHGGAMNYDSATYYDDQSMIDAYAANGVILIIPAFRLGFTEQFSLGDNQELVPSNLGIHDALHALTFVKKEAAAFGGDADAITVMGHSFGGGLSILLAFSPARKLQVRQFISMSPGLYFDAPEYNEQLSREMVKRAGCTYASKKVTLACMKKKSGPELLAIQRQLEEEGYAAGKSALFGGVIMRPPLFPFNSVPDLMKNPPNASLLVGTTVGELDFDRDAKPRTITGSLVGARNPNELFDFYANQTAAGKNNQTHHMDSQGLYVAAYIAAAAVRDSGNKVFLYSYDQPTHNRHTDDLSYLMGIHMFERDDNEKEIAKFYPKLFVNFTKFGEPSPLWKPMNLKDRYYSIKVDLATGRAPEMHDFYEKATIDYWIRTAPTLDKIITAAKVAGKKVQWDKITDGFRDLTIEGDSSPPVNETLIPVVLVHASYFPSLLLLCSVFFLGVVLGRYLMGDSSAREEERTWLLGQEIEQGAKPPAYAEQLF